MSTDTHDQPFDPNQRRLCPDGSCVGVIGEDGKCKLCGTADPDGPPVPGLRLVAPPSPSDEPEPVDDTPAEAGAFDPNRRLCGDDACIGVLDESGRCKVCGRAG